MKAQELIGTIITNTGSNPSSKITNVLPADNVGHFRTQYNYVLQLDNKDEKHTIESLLLRSLPKEIVFDEKLELIKKIQELEIDLSIYRDNYDDSMELSTLHLAVSIFLTDTDNRLQ